LEESLLRAGVLRPLLLLVSTGLRVDKLQRRKTGGQFSRQQQTSIQ
jgi:hypothetical protein